MLWASVVYEVVEALVLWVLWNLMLVPLGVPGLPSALHVWALAGLIQILVGIPIMLPRLEAVLQQSRLSIVVSKCELDTDYKRKRMALGANLVALVLCAASWNIGDYFWPIAGGR